MATSATSYVATYVLLKSVDKLNMAYELNRDEIIETYFNVALVAPNILEFVVNVHGIRLSFRQLKSTARETQGMQETKSSELLQ